MCIGRCASCPFHCIVERIIGTLVCTYCIIKFFHRIFICFSKWVDRQCVLGAIYKTGDRVQFIFKYYDLLHIRVIVHCLASVWAIIAIIPLSVLGIFFVKCVDYLLRACFIKIIQTIRRVNVVIQRHVLGVLFHQTLIFLILQFGLFAPLQFCCHIFVRRICPTISHRNIRRIGKFCAKRDQFIIRWRTCSRNRTRRESCSIGRIIVLHFYQIHKICRSVFFPIRFIRIIYAKTFPLIFRRIS